MPLMEPRSPWASTHGEKTSIPNIRIDLAEFGIGKLLSCGRLTSNTRANSPVPFLLGTNLTRLQEQVKLKGCSHCDSDSGEGKLWPKIGGRGFFSECSSAFRRGR